MVDNYDSRHNCHRLNNYPKHDILFVTNTLNRLGLNGFFALLLCLCLVACEAPEDYESLLSKGKLELDAKNYRSANIHLKNAINLNQHKTAEARLLLGRMYFELGDYNNAERFLTPAVDALKEHLYAQQYIHLLGFSLLYNNKLAELESLLFDAEENILPPNYHTALHLRQLLAQQKFIAFKQTYERTNTELKAALEVKMAYAICLFAQQNSKSLSVTDDILSESPEFAEAILLKAKILIAEQQFSLATDHLSKLVSLVPSLIPIKYELAKIAIKAKRLDIANNAIAGIKRSGLTHYKTEPLEAYLAFEHQDFQSALKFGLIAIKNGHSSISNYLITGTSAYLLKKFELANESFEKVIPRLSANHPTMPMIVATKVAIGELDSAYELLIQNKINNDETVQLANTITRHKLQQGEHQQAYQLQHATNIGEGVASSLIRESAILKAAVGDNNSIKAIEAALQQSDGNNELIFSYIVLALANKQYEQALEHAQKWHQDEPENVSALNLLAKTQVYLEQYSKAQQNYIAALQLAPNNIQSYQFLTYYFASQHDWKNARHWAEAAYQQFPTDLEFTDRLIKIYLNSGQSSKPLIAQIRALETIEPKITETMALALKQNAAWLWFEQVFTPSLLDYQMTESSWRVYLSSKVATKNTKDLGAEVSAFKDKFGLYQTERLKFIVELLLSSKHFSELLAVLKESQHNNVSLDNFYAYQFLAALDAEDEKTLDLAFASLLKQKNQFEIGYYRGELERFRGNPKQALEAYLRYFDYRPEFLTLAKIKVLSKRNNSPLELKPLVEKLLASTPKNQSFRLNIYRWFASDDPQFATEVLHSNKLEPLIVKNATLSHDLAALYHKLGKTGLAKKYIDIAVTLDGDNQKILKARQQIYDSPTSKS